MNSVATTLLVRMKLGEVIMFRAFSLIVAVLISQNLNAWSPEGLDKELYPIARLESSFGKNTNHAPHSRGEYWSSVGALGLKPVTAHEVYQSSKVLQARYPGLEAADVFTAELKKNDRFYNELCSTHWRRLRKAFPEIERAVFAWRWGRGASERADWQRVVSDSYVVAYHTVQEQSP